MRIVVQRVKEARCTIEGKITGRIDQGFMLLVGFSKSDTREIARKYAEKVSKLRIFSDENGKMNRSIFEVSGSILSISQFTLYGDAWKSNRPGFTEAMGGTEASELYDYFNDVLRELGLRVETGIFGADMQIALVNDGPVTIILQ